MSPWWILIVGPRAARRGGCSSRDSAFCLILCYAEPSRVGRGRGRVVNGAELGWLGVCRGQGGSRFEEEATYERADGV